MARSTKAALEAFDTSPYQPQRWGFTLRWRSDRCRDHEQCAYEKLIPQRCHERRSSVGAGEGVLSGSGYAGRACDPMLPGWTYELTLPVDAKRDALSTMEVVSNDYGERESDAQEPLWTPRGLYFDPETAYLVNISLPDDESDVHVHFNPISQQRQNGQSSETPLILALLAAVMALLFAIAKMQPSGCAGATASAHSTGTDPEHTEPLLPKSSGAERQEQMPSPVRLASLDAFRGFTICLMIFVNYGGSYTPSYHCARLCICGGFHFFTHSVWDGVTIADLVFPWFAWIMGFGIFLSAYSSVLLQKRHQSQQKLPQLPIFTRSLKLFALGLFLNTSPDWSHWRIPGVLQALSVAYFVVAMLNSVFPPAPNDSKKWKRFILSHVALGLLPLVAVNLSATFFLHVLGCPTGYLGPGGSANDGKYQNCTGGAHLYVDTLIFGRNHLFQSPTCQKVYHTGAYDPEGALNWLMVAATAYLGYISAALVMIPRQPPAGTKQQIIQTLVGFGAALLLASVTSGGVLVTREPWLPLNKNLWSISYVLLSSGLACLLEMIFLVTVDRSAAGSWAGWPLVSVGKNSIFIYVMHEICQSFAPFSPRAIHTEDALSHTALLVFNVIGVLSPGPPTNTRVPISAHVQSELFQRLATRNNIATGQNALIRIPPTRVSPATSSNSDTASRRRTHAKGSIWTPREHERFLEGLELYTSGPWKVMACYVGSKITRQTITHAQKHRHKIARRQRGLRITVHDIRDPWYSSNSHQQRPSLSASNGGELEFDLAFDSGTVSDLELATFMADLGLMNEPECA